MARILRVALLAVKRDSSFGCASTLAAGCDTSQSNKRHDTEIFLKCGRQPGEESTIVAG
jgi:hypothetical protein